MRLCERYPIGKISVEMRLNASDVLPCRNYWKVKLQNIRMRTLSKMAHARQGIFSSLHFEGSNMPGLPVRCSCSPCKSWITFNLVSKVVAALLMYWYQQQPQPCKPTLSLSTRAGSPRQPDESQLWQTYRCCNYIPQHRLKGIQVI